MSAVTAAFDGIPDHTLLPDTLDLDALAGSSGGDLRCSSPDPTRYYDAGSQTLEGSGATLAQQAGGGRHGLRGTVVPRATLRGASMGGNHHLPTEVVIDPDSRNSVVVDLRKITPAMATAAIGRVDRAMGPATDIDQQRSRCTVAFHVLKEMTKTAAPRAVDSLGRPTAAAAAPMPAPPAVDPAVSAAPHQAGLMAAFPSQPQATVAPRIAPPGATAAVAVRFEMPGFGAIDTTYAATRRQGPPGAGILVLIADIAQPGRFTPAVSDQAMAVSVGGSGTVLLVESVGITFDHGGQAFCVLLVVDEKPI